VPSAESIVQVTAVADVPVTVARNCTPWPPLRLVVDGETATVTADAAGVSVTTADFVTPGLLVDVAVTVTVCDAVIEAGAV